MASPKVIRPPMSLSPPASPIGTPAKSTPKKGTPKAQPIDYVELFTTLPSVSLVTKSLGGKDARRIVEALKVPKVVTRNLWLAGKQYSCFRS